MTQKEREIFQKYVQAGRTVVRHQEERDQGDDRTYIYGIVMETIPYADIDSDSYGSAHVEMPVVAWFSGYVGPFPMCMIHFDIEGEWWTVDDILMGEDAS